VSRLIVSPSMLSEAWRNPEKRASTQVGIVTGAWLESAIAIQRFSVQVRYNCKERKNGELLPKRHQMKHLKF